MRGDGGRRTEDESDYRYYYYYYFIDLGNVFCEEIRVADRRGFMISTSTNNYLHVGTAAN